MDNDTFSISNSLPLLLAFRNDWLLGECDQYSSINHSILTGIDSYERQIPTQRGMVNRMMHNNVAFGPNGISIREKPMPAPLGCFEDYRHYVQSRIGVLLQNARDPARRRPMQVFSTQSRGYDSTAVNAIAAQFGIDMVFTSPNPKEDRSFFLGRPSTSLDDDGTPVCELLDLSCTRIDRLGFLRSAFPEHYYWAGLDNNGDLNLHQIQSYISTPTLLLTGNLGEIWYTQDAIGPVRLRTFNDQLIRWDQTGHGLGEVRLTCGMVQVAVPFIGARRRANILKITESHEMQPWRLGGSYDRPIPRRIAEEAGIPRNMFGQNKLASIVHTATPNLPFTPELRRDFFAHLSKLGLLGRGRIMLLPLVQRVNNWIYWKNPNRYLTNRKAHPILGYCAYALSRLRRRPIRIGLIWTALDSYLYAFCVNKVRTEYRAALSDLAKAHDVENVDQARREVSQKHKPF